MEASAAGIEVECSVIGNREPVASDPGEIVLVQGEGGWYDYEAKYTPGGMQLIVPARVPARVIDRIRELALDRLRAGRLLGPRPGRLLRRRAPRSVVLVNELNTMPGFTATSVFASLFEAGGVSYPELLDRLLLLALERHAEERRHRVLRATGRRAG